jgi:transposase
MEKYYLGGDISKGYSDFLLLNQEKKIAIKHFQLYDNAKGHFLLEQRLLDFCQEHPGCKIVAGVESTGGYENNWFEALCELQDRVNIEVARINPIGTHHSSKASLDRVVTDKNASRTIAEYLINYNDKLSFRKPDKYSSLKRQWKFIRMLTKQKTQLFNQLEKNLYIANPELLRYTKYNYPKWLLRVIMQYPTAKDLSQARIATLSAIPYVSEQRATALIQRAKTSVASATDRTMGNLISTMVKDIIRLSKRIDKQCKIIADDCNLEELAILKSFKGIGDYSAIGLLIYIGEVDNFASTKKLSSFAGIHPTWKQSGDGVFGMHISKKGNKEIRALLHNVAFTAIRCQPLIKEIYRNHVSKGKNKTSAIVACMHKILRIVYGMLKHKEMFNPEKDKANSTKQEIKSEVNKINSPVDPDAPISARQFRKRKQQEMSQNEITSFNTGSVSHCSEILLPEKK